MEDLLVCKPWVYHNSQQINEVPPTVELSEQREGDVEDKEKSICSMSRSDRDQKNNKHGFVERDKEKRFNF